MDELIVRRLRGEATDIEIRQLDHWRAESPENERDYSAFVAHWERTAEPEAAAVRPAPAVGRIVDQRQVLVGDIDLAEGEAQVHC